MRHASTLVLAASLALSAACSQSHGVVPLPPVGATLTQTVGPAGATLALEGVELRIPAGALAAATEIRMEVSGAAPPSFLVPFSPVVRFEPEGLSFAAPIEVRLPYDGDGALATVFWSAREGGAFVPRETRVEGSYAIAESTHFSQAFVGTACTGEDCCDRANGRLDVLLMVDNSNSMAEEQASLEAQIPRLARALASGDVDDDGVQDFPALESVRVGVVTSDMGTAGFAVPTCDRGTFGAHMGDDGILRTRGNTSRPGCMASYPAVAEFGADATGSIEEFAQQVSCVATVGTGGCGFEQQLESVLKAVTPSTAEITFFESTTGHADGENAALFRDDAMLAVLMLSDENDCAIADAELANMASTTYTEDLNLRCFAHPEAIHATSRYVDGLLATRTNPADLIYAAITGASPDAIEAADGDWAALLADPTMVEEIDPASEPTAPRLRPACNVEGRGIAFPGRRIVSVAQGLDAAGAGTVVASICEADFTPVVDAILARVAARARGECSAD